MKRIAVALSHGQGLRLYGPFFVKGASRHFCRASLLHSLFDPRREHSSVLTAYYRRRRSVTVNEADRRRAQSRSRSALVWAFLCQGCITPFLSCFVASFFVRPAPRAFFRPDRILPSPWRSVTVNEADRRRAQ